MSSPLDLLPRETLGLILSYFLLHSLDAGTGHAPSTVGEGAPKLQAWLTHCTLGLLFRGTLTHREMGWRASRAATRSNPKCCV